MRAGSTSPGATAVRRCPPRGTAATVCVALSWCVLAQPAAAFEKVAHLQPAFRTPPPVATEAEARVHPENLAAKARQDAFDARIQRRNQQALASLCRGCASRSGADAAMRPLSFDRAAGARVTAESIYSRSLGFDPAAAYLD